MLNLLLILILAIGFYSGARRGLVLQVILTVGYFISYLCAKEYYLSLGKKLELLVPYPTPTAGSKLVFFNGEEIFKLDNAFYAGLAFLIILFIGWAVTRFVGLLAHNLTFVPVIKQVNLLGGGVLGFAMSYLAVFFILLVLTTIPMDLIQNLFKGSSLARFIVERTPVFSKNILELWLSSTK